MTLTVGAVMLRGWIRDLGASVRFVADDLKCTQHHVNAMMRGTVKPALAMAQRIETLTRGLVTVQMWAENASDGESAGNG